MTASVVDTGLLLRVLYTALAAGIGVSVVFSMAVLGLTRSGDMRRQQRTTAALSYAVLGVAGLVMTGALIVYGLVLLAHKH